MLLDFFPSRRLTIYLAKLFFTRILAVLVMLVLVLLMLDLLGETGKIMAIEGNGEPELMRYAGLRVPQLIARLLPYSVLLATIITLATLNQNLEVTAMKAAGLSAHQILAPLLLTAAVMSALLFAFNERIVTRSTSTLKAWQAVEYARVPIEEGGRANVYFADGDNVLMARQMSGAGKDTVLREVTFYQRDPAGMILRQISGSQARFAAPGWMLENPVGYDVATAEEMFFEAPQLVGEGVTLGQVALRKVDPDAETLGELNNSIAALDSAGRRTSELKAKWWHKLSGPLSAFLMPLLGAVAGFGLARSGGLFARAVIGMALGFAYFVVDNAALAMGSFGGYPPFLAAWAPFLLFVLVGETVLIRTEE